MQPPGALGSWRGPSLLSACSTLEAQNTARTRPRCELLGSRAPAPAGPSLELGKRWAGCVGRESNPGQLLGRQLCSPLYHQRCTARAGPRRQALGSHECIPAARSAWRSSVTTPCTQLGSSAARQLCRSAPPQAPPTHGRPPGGVAPVPRALPWTASGGRSRCLAAAGGLRDLPTRPPAGRTKPWCSGRSARPLPAARGHGSACQPSRQLGSWAAGHLCVASPGAQGGSHLRRGLSSGAVGTGERRPWLGRGDQPSAPRGRREWEWGWEWACIWSAVGGLGTRWRPAARWRAEGGQEGVPGGERLDGRRAAPATKKGVWPPRRGIEPRSPA